MALDIPALVRSLENCPCGRSHKIDIAKVEIRENVLKDCGRILKENIGGQKLHAVFDQNTLKASDGILDILKEAGYTITTTAYVNLKKATMEESERIIKESSDADLVLSIGTGSLNDICRYACFKIGKPFAIFATAPSMDGFLSQQAPLMDHGFKLTFNAKAPQVLMADVNILAQSPTELKAAGLGDLIGKYTALADWRVSHLVTGEYYCPRIDSEMRKAVDAAVVLAKSGLGGTQDKGYAKSLMEALSLSGLMIYLAGCTRPASGAEHHLSHFWEMQYAANGWEQLYHGKKVGIATAVVADIYHNIAKLDQIETRKTPLSEERLRPVFGKLYDMLMKENTPNPIDQVDPEFVKAHWQDIRQIVKDCVPDGEEIRNLLKSAGGEPDYRSAGIPEELGYNAPRFGHYARFRMTLLRITNDMIVHGEEIYQ